MCFAASTPSTTYNSPASTYATPSPGRAKTFNSTPLSTKTPAPATPTLTPVSSRKALDVGNKKGKEAASTDVSDWLDEMDDVDLSQYESMETK